MLTPQEVSERAFQKASFGGYNMAQVDEFLDILTGDYSALYNENAVLKNKMKVLVEKVEEYRNTEDARAAARDASAAHEAAASALEASRGQILAQIRSYRPLVKDMGAAKGKYSRGEKFWAMNETTYTTLIAEGMAVNANGVIVAGVAVQDNGDGFCHIVVPFYKQGPAQHRGGRA